MRTTRRTFLTAASLATLSTQLRVRGANDDLRIAFIGVRGKGYHAIQQFAPLPGVRVVAVCDPDTQVLAERAEQASVPGDAAFTDMRRIFDSKEIDAVVISTPNHWHALAAVWACQAGKDVYVEKPCSHTIWEGRQMIAAARKHNRIMQVGTQRRSDENLREVFGQLRDGELGKILRVRVLHYSRRDGIGKVNAPQTVPAHIDYNLWAGPAPMTPIMRQQFHYDWHWFWETGNGELGNNGPHAMDLARWVLGYDKLAPRITSTGGRYVWGDNGETPNTQIVYYDYSPAPIITEIRNLPDTTGSKNADVYKGLRTGIIVECEGGYFAGMDGGTIYDNDGKRIRQINGDGGRHHPANFVKAVRSGNPGDLNCDIAQGHLSTTLCHQGNISHRVGRTSEIVQHDHTRGEAYNRMLEHLHANGVEVGKEKMTYGPSLTFDPATERFTGEHADAANAHLKGTYREPFVMPQLA